MKLEAMARQRGLTPKALVTEAIRKALPRFESGNLPKHGAR